MKQLLFLILLISTQIGFTQGMDYDLIMYHELGFSSSKSEIEKTLGNPNNIFEPKYDCGFLSSHDQAATFYTLDYTKIKFTGNDKDKYLIEEVVFENDKNVRLHYGEFILTYETNSADLITIFGGETAERLTDDFTGAIILFHVMHDDGVRLHLKNGKLIKWEYWSPC